MALHSWELAGASSVSALSIFRTWALLRRMEFEENDPVFPEKPKYLAVPHQSHSARAPAATPKTHPSPPSILLSMCFLEETDMSACDAQFWGDKFLKMIAHSLPLWIRTWDFCPSGYVHFWVESAHHPLEFAEHREKSLKWKTLKYVNCCYCS